MKNLCLDMPQEGARHVIDEDAHTIMRKIAYCDSCPEFQTLEQDKRFRMIVKMRREGLSLRQVSRLTGETVYRIQKDLSNKEPSPVCSEFQTLEQDKRFRMIVKMRREGLSLRQVSRLTGETVYRIQKDLSNKEPAPV